jgi:hypothetical protein
VEDTKTEREDLRVKLLKDLYEYHFSNGGKVKSVATDIKDTEIKLAYVYLSEKGLIDLDNFSHQVFAAVRLNAYGIDEVENEM